MKKWNIYRAVLYFCTFILFSSKILTTVSLITMILLVRFTRINIWASSYAFSASFTVSIATFCRALWPLCPITKCGFWIQKIGSKTITALDLIQKLFTLTLFFIIAFATWRLLFNNFIKWFQMEVTVDCLLLFGHDRSGSEPECSHAKRYMLTKHRLLNIQSFNGFKILSYLVNSIKISCKNRSVQYQSR